MSSCPYVISMLVKFNIHKDVIPGEKEEAEVNFYVNLRCFEEAEPDNSPQFIKYRHVGSEIPREGVNKMNLMELYSHSEEMGEGNEGQSVEWRIL